MMARFAAHIRSRYQLLCLIAPFFLGQLCGAFGWYPTELKLLAAASAALGIAGMICNVWPALSVSSALGVLSVLLQAEPIVDYTALQSDRFMIAVTADPRRPSPNVLSLIVLVEQVFSTEKGRLLPTQDALTGKKLLCRGVEVPWRSLSGVEKGDRFLAQISVRSFEHRRSPITFEGSQRRRGIAATCRLLQLMRLNERPKPGWYPQIVRFLADYPGFELQGGLLASLIFGSRDSITQTTEEAFKRAGLSHLLVFSGTQVAIIFAICHWLAYPAILGCLYGLGFYRGASGARLFSLLMTLFFVLTIGADASIVRALVAAIVTFMAQQGRRRTSILWTMLATAGVMAAGWPACFLEPGLQLTFAALFGIWLGTVRRSYVWGSLYTSAATNAICLFWFHTISPIGFLVNPVVVPLVSGVTTIAGIPLVAASFVSIPYAHVGLELLLTLLGWFLWLVWKMGEVRWAFSELSPSTAVIAGACMWLILLIEVVRLQIGRSRLRHSPR